MAEEPERIAALVRDLSQLGQPCCAAAVKDATKLLAAAHAEPARLLALADEVIRVDGVLPLLRLVQSVDYDPSNLRPRTTADPEAAALAEASLDCCSVLCAAAGAALEAAGWSLVEAPEDGRPAYLHEASSVLRNSAPDIDWPQAEGENGEAGEGGKTWSRQLLLDLPTLVVPLECGASEDGASRPRKRRQRDKGSLRWPVKVVVHEPGSHSVLDVIVDGQADCLFRQLIRHDVQGAWRHTEGTAAVEISLEADGQLSPDADLLSWSKTTMAAVPLLLRSRGAAGRPAALPGPGDPPLRALVIGTSNCCDLLGFYARYVPSLVVEAVETGDARAAKRLQHLAEHFGLPSAHRSSACPERMTLVEALRAPAEGGNEATQPYDFVAMDLASEAPCPPADLMAAAAGKLGQGGLFSVGAGSDMGLAAGLHEAAQAAGLSVLAVLADAGSREDDASSEIVLLLGKGWEDKLKAEDISAQAWESALSGGLGRLLAHGLPMKIDSPDEDSDAEPDTGANGAPDPLGRLWLFWSEAERTREPEAAKAPAAEVAEDDQAWDLFGGGQEPAAPGLAEVPDVAASDPQQARGRKRVYE